MITNIWVPIFQVLLRTLTPEKAWHGLLVMTFTESGYQTSM